MPKIEVLIGMIASGKSTYAKTRGDQGALVVSHDDLTQMLHAKYRYEPGLRSAYRQMEEALATIALREGRDVVIDRTHLTRESRARWVEFARNARCPVAAVIFPRYSAPTHAERRFLSDPRGRSLAKWTEVATHHEGQAEAEPLRWEEEGFSEGYEAPPPPDDGMTLFERRWRAVIKPVFLLMHAEGRTTCHVQRDGADVHFTVDNVPTRLSPPIGWDLANQN